MTNKIIIIDGYNFIHKVNELKKILDKNLEASRNALINYIGNLLKNKISLFDVYVVFDGFNNADRFINPNINTYGIKVLYSPHKREADDTIIDVIKQNSKKQTCVITDDNYVANNARALNSRSIKVAEFIKENSKKVILKSKKLNLKEKTALPIDKRNKITNDLMKLWGEE